MAEELLQPLTVEQVALLKHTFRVIDTDRLAMRFYTSLFVRHPEVRHLFPDDLTVLSTKIVSVFELVVHSFKERSNGEFLLQPEVIRPLRALGELHSQKGVINEYYGFVNDLLLKCIHEELPHDFSAETEIAWKLALNHLTVAMLSDVPLDTSLNHDTMRDSFNHLRSLLFKK
jgi:hemoglobin-like flavoprotein